MIEVPFYVLLDHIMDQYVKELESSVLRRRERLVFQQGPIYAQLDYIIDHYVKKQESSVLRHHKKLGFQRTPQHHCPFFTNSTEHPRFVARSQFNQCDLFVSL